MEELRRAKYLTSEMDENGGWNKVWVYGWFHRWADNYETYDDCVAKYVEAIVEDEDGNVRVIRPEELVFLKKEKPKLVL